MRRGAAPVLAWSLWGLWFAVSVVTLVWVVRGQGDDPFGLAAVGYATVGALVGSRQPRNAVGWLMLVFALAVALQTAGEAYTWTRDNPGYLPVAWSVQWVVYLWIAVILVFMPLLFPDGRLLSRRWQPALWLGVVALVASMVGTAFRPGSLRVHTPVDNPYAAGGRLGDALTVTQVVGHTLLVLAAILALASVVLRFRRSRGAEHQQVKWFTFAVVLLALSWGVMVLGLALPGRWPQAVENVGWTMFVLTAVIGVPVAAGVAIFRHRLYDIDLVINRTLVYAALTAALAVTYVGLVVLLGQVLNPLTNSSDLAVAGSTLAVAALFRTARRRIQSAVDRRFYRSRYDAARTMDAFASRLRHELDLDAVGADLCAAARETVQPAHVSLWLRS